MTLYTTLNTYEGIEPEAGTPLLREYLGAVAQDAWNMNPLQSANRAYQLSEAIVGGYDIDESDGGIPAITHVPPRTSRLELEEQQQRIRAAGLEGALQPTQGYTEESLDIIIQRKQEELAIREVREAAPMSYAPLGLAAGLGTALADPVNVAAAFFPVVGEARAFSLLRGASGVWGRAGVRAGIGAVEGAVGSAVVEPTIRAAKTFEQADYEMLDSLLNVGFGAIFSAALRPAAGFFGERLRAGRGMRQPWEITAPTDITENLRASFARDVSSAYAAAHPEATPVQVQENAQAAAALWDARARTWAYDMGRSPEEYYQRYRPEFVAGATDIVGETLEHAMYRNKSPNLQSFIDEVLSGNPQDKKSFFGMGTASRDTPNITDAEIILASDQVRHIRSGHPDFAEWERIPDVIRNGEHALLGNNRVTGKETYAFVLHDADGRSTVVVGAPASGKSGNRITVLTAFRDSRKGVEDWIAQKNAAIYQSAAEITASPSPRGDTPSGSGGISTDTLGQPGAAVNALPRAAITFPKEAESRAVISFFSAADLTSAPHELYHIFRREMAQTAADASAPARVRENWKTVEEFVGAKPGEKWTAAMEEKFAKAGERFLLEGKAPSPALTGVFERLRQWFQEIYGNAEASGLPISKEMRDIFSDMLSMPMEDADTAFRYSLGRIATDDASRDFAPSGAPDAFDQAIAAGDIQAVRTLTDESGARLQENMRGVAAADPKYAADLDAEYRPQLEQADADIARTAAYRDVLRDAALCETRR